MKESGRFLTVWILLFPRCGWVQSFAVGEDSSTHWKSCGILGGCILFWSIKPWERQKLPLSLLMGSRRWCGVVIEGNCLCTLSPWGVCFRLISQRGHGNRRRLLWWDTSPLRSRGGTEVSPELVDGCICCILLSSAWLSPCSGVPDCPQHPASQYCCYSLLTGMCFPGAHTLLLLRLTLWWQLPGCLSKAPFRASPTADRKLQC